MQANPKKNIIYRIIKFTALIFILIAGILIKLTLCSNGKPNIAVDYVVKVNELTKPQNYDPSQNAAPLIDEALRSFKFKFRRGHFLGRYPQLISFDRILTNKLDEIKKWLDSNEKSFTLISQATEKPYYWEERHLRPDHSNATRIYFDNQHSFNAISKALIWRARIHKKNGEINEAFSDLILAYSIIDYDTRESLYSHIGAFEIRELVYKMFADITINQKIDAEVLFETQKNLEKISLEDRSTAIEFSRLISLDTIQRSFTDDGNGDGEFILESFSEHLNDNSMTKSNRFNLGYYIRELKDYFKTKKRYKSNIDSRKITTIKLNKAYDLAQHLYQQTPHKVLKETGISYGKNISKIAQNNFFALLGEVSFNWAYQRYHKTLCQHRALISILAINRYEVDKGHLPTSLEKLAEDGYIKNAPIDPYSDKPLIYKLIEDGFILYSVGHDFTDNIAKNSELKSWEETKDRSDYIFWPVTLNNYEKPQNTEMDSYLTNPDHDPNNFLVYW